MTPSPPSTRPSDARGRRSSAFVRERHAPIDARGRPALDAVLPPARARKAFERGLAGHVRGKIVPRVDDSRRSPEGIGRPYYISTFVNMRTSILMESTMNRR